ncbi:MAG: cytochrome c oxidase subunit II [Actinomycetota bacterium]|nr:cytochrome c oxidase subunit II [Actinomycetota bacterium]
MTRPRARGRNRPRIFFSFALLASLALAACTADAPYNYLHPVGPAARAADALWDLTFGIAVAVFVIVEGALLYIIIKYRRRSDRDQPTQVHGNTRLEILWTLIPVLLLTIVAFRTVGGIFESAQEPTNPLEVSVTGHQWWWQFRYEESGLLTANEVHVPVGRPVQFTIRSADVVHSFWVPKLGGKQDAVPGRVIKTTYLAPRAGEYLGECAEYCGLSHANMRLRVVAHPPAEFDRWHSEQMQNAAQPTDPLAARGAQLFATGQCVGCHTVKGTPAQGVVGPDLTHFASRRTFAGSIFERTDENLAKWLADPPEQKPGAKMPDLNLRDDEIQALVAYLQTLR